MRFAFFLTVIVLLVVAGCNSGGNNGDKPIGFDNNCKIDTDCISSGCSSQLCVSTSNTEGIITTCEYRAEYECFALSSCGCVSGQCQWDANDEYRECLVEKLELP